MQIANVSSTLGSIGDKAQYIKDDDARKANPFAAKIVAYKMAKVRPTTHFSSRLYDADATQLSTLLRRLLSPPQEGLPCCVLRILRGPVTIVSPLYGSLLTCTGEWPSRHVTVLAPLLLLHT